VYVSLETLRRAVGLADSLAELKDPAGFAGIVLPGLAAMVGCDIITYNEIGQALGQTRYADYPADALDTRPVPSTRRPSPCSRRMCTSTRWSTTTVPPAAGSR
jgi:hypothetical protein